MNVAIGQSKSESDEYRTPIVTEGIIHLSLKKAWELWTTEEGVQSFMAPKARIDLTPGGIYEIYFAPDASKGNKGVEGTIVLAVQDQKMLNLTWTIPPYIPEIRPFFTAVQIYFEGISKNSTKLTIVHGGWGTGPKWDEAKKHFRMRWPEVIKSINEKYPNSQDLSQ